MSWYYWINFPLWMASLAFLFPETIALMTGFELDLIPTLAIELAFVWIVVFMSFSKVSDSGWILNLSAVLKVLIAVSVGGLGIYYAVTNGFASDMSPATFMPDLTNTNALTYLSIILFNFMGFEVICTFAGAMKNPSEGHPQGHRAGRPGHRRHLPVLLVRHRRGHPGRPDRPGLRHDLRRDDHGGRGVSHLHAHLHHLPGHPVREHGSWSFGVNFVAEHAARKKNMPKVFAHESKKNQMPTGAAIVNGVVASVLVLLSPVMELAGFDSFFWIFFSMNIVFLLISYIPMFPAFLKLRKIDLRRTACSRCRAHGVALVVAWVPVIRAGAGPSSPPSCR